MAILLGNFEPKPQKLRFVSPSECRNMCRLSAGIHRVQSADSGRAPLSLIAHAPLLLVFLLPATEQVALFRPHCMQVSQVLRYIMANGPPRARSPARRVLRHLRALGSAGSRASDRRRV